MSGRDNRSVLLTQSSLDMSHVRGSFFGIFFALIREGGETIKALKGGVITREMRVWREP